ncbi:MAG: glycosyltransferase [Candidatus Sumerlaeota bacterium]|nr:glycosyltransferase [Candidatus Sumerlaeota bacterium]
MESVSPHKRLVVTGLGVVASLGSEGSSRVSLECLASGVPVVATRVGGIPELLEGGRLGALVEPGNPEALAAAISALLRDPARRAVLARQGREAAETRHSFDRWAGEIEEVYRLTLVGG